LKLKNKKAASFGCYGWSGESVEKLNGLLTKSGFELINHGIKCLWNPDNEKSIEKFIEFGNHIN